MICPGCQSPLYTKKIGEIDVDECIRCKGMWFDKDELRKAKDHTESDIGWMDFEIWKHPDLFRVAERRARCPRCEQGMVAIDYGETGVEVDYCISCEGVWLDAGEFEKIIESLIDEMETKSVSQYVRASLEEAREILTGSEGFASEWNDFRTVVRMLQYRILTDNPKLHKRLVDLQVSSPGKT